MEGNKGSSAALECKRLLEFHRRSGKKSDRKYQKRENSRAVQRMHFWVRAAAEKFNGIKWWPKKLPKGENIRDH